MQTPTRFHLFWMIRLLLRLRVGKTFAVTHEMSQDSLSYYDQDKGVIGHTNNTNWWKKSDVPHINACGVEISTIST